MSQGIDRRYIEISNNKMTEWHKFDKHKNMTIMVHFPDGVHRMRYPTISHSNHWMATIKWTPIHSNWCEARLHMWSKTNYKVWQTSAFRLLRVFLKVILYMRTSMCLLFTVRYTISNFQKRGNQMRELKTNIAWKIDFTFTIS